MLIKAKLNKLDGQYKTRVTAHIVIKYQTKYLITIYKKSDETIQDKSDCTYCHQTKYLITI